MKAVKAMSVLYGSTVAFAFFPFFFCLFSQDIPFRLSCVMFHLLIISLRTLQLLLRLQIFAIGATPSRTLLLLSLFSRRVPVAPSIFFLLGV